MTTAETTRTAELAAAEREAYQVWDAARQNARQDGATADDKQTERAARQVWEAAAAEMKAALEAETAEAETAAITPELAAYCHDEDCGIDDAAPAIADCTCGAFADADDADETPIAYYAAREANAAGIVRQDANGHAATCVCGRTHKSWHAARKCFEKILRNGDRAVMLHRWPGGILG